MPARASMVSTAPTMFSEIPRWVRCAVVKLAMVARQITCPK